MMSQTRKGKRIIKEKKKKKAVKLATLWKYSEENQRS